MSSFKMRPIQTSDNQQVAQLIRTVMTTFGAVGEGYSIQDPEVEAMAEAYSNPRSIYYILENASGEIAGAGGIAPLRGGDEDTCELKKMYFYETARGHGLGAKMLQQLIEDARQRGFKKMYLESISAMKQAIKLYEKVGFEKLEGKMGNTGHTGCGVFYLKNL